MNYFWQLLRIFMRLISLFLFLIVSFTLQAQQPAVKAENLPSRSQLEENRKEILKAIAETQKELDAIKQDKNASLSQLSALQQKLANRQRLITNINQEISNIDNSIQISSIEVGNLKGLLEQYRIRYAQSIRYAYESRSSYDMMAFLFSSYDFNDAVRRMKYLQKFRDFRKQQVELIRQTQTKLQDKIGALNVEKTQKDELLNSQIQQKQVLVKETDETNQVVTKLKGKEGELMKEIEKKRIVANRINEAIKLVIEREMQLAREKAEAEEKKRLAAAAKANPNVKEPVKTPGKNPAEVVNPTKTPVTKTPKPAKTETEQPLLLTPSDLALSNNFEGNKGKLYWPVEKGFISDHFGTHPHPLAEKVMIDNPGIDIRTADNATVRAVFEGTVSSVFSTVGSNQVVIVQHGNYFTVYNGLATVNVKKDQHVSTKEVIGIVAANDEGVPTINFQIWKAGTKKSQIKLNPEQWVSKIK